MLWSQNLLLYMFHFVLTHYGLQGLGGWSRKELTMQKISKQGKKNWKKDQMVKWKWYALKGYIFFDCCLSFCSLFCATQILKTNNSFHRQFATQISSAVVTSDLFAVWYPGLCSRCHLIHGSFSGNPADPQKAHIQLKPTAALQTLNKRNEKTQSLRFRD